MNCSKCGASLRSESQKFCEKCGAEISNLPIPQEKAPVNTPITSRQPSYRKGSLFDINRNYYILKEKYWDWGSGVSSLRATLNRKYPR